MLAVLPKDQVLIFYCDGEGCKSSAELGTLMREPAFSNVKVFLAGGTIGSLTNNL